MKILFYLLTFICGLIGILGLFRTVEVSTSSGGVKPVQILIAVVALSWMGFSDQSSQQMNSYRAILLLL